MDNGWKAALQVIERLEQSDYEAVLVGGAVRDYIMNRPFHDVDVATSALPQQVKNVFSNTVDVGIEHGTVLVLDTGEPIEVTTYRTESTYSDFRRPDEVKFVRELREDLKRRDFTMNAIAMRRNGDLVDYYGGVLDIQNGLIRAVGNANERFQEDALRMLRAARFQAQLGFEIEEMTLKAISHHAPFIKHIAMERIAIELGKLFAGAFAAKGITTIEMSELSVYLPGKFSGDWSNISIESIEQGWAYFYTLQSVNDVEVLNAYKCSNKLKAYAKMIRRLVELQDWNVETIFEHSLADLQFATKIRKKLSMPFMNEQMIQEKKKALPIQSMQELVVTGKDIVEWENTKKGSWIKERLNDLKVAVLMNEVKNDRESIKEWYDAKFN